MLTGRDGGRCPTVTLTSSADPPRCTLTVAISCGFSAATAFSSCGVLAIGAPPILQHHVARPQAAFACRPALHDAGDQHALLDREIERLGDLGREVARLDADPAARDAAVLDQAFHHLARRRHRNREADAEAAAAARIDRGVDAEQVAGDVDQRAARVAGIDRRVGLDEVLEDVDAERVAAERADDARGHRLADAERIADREHDVADLEVVDVAERDHRQLVEVDLQHRDVGIGVGADRAGARAAAVAERDLDVVGAVDDVVVGEQVALGRDDHARAEADLALLRHLARTVAEEEAERRIVGARPRRVGPARGDAHHRRRGALGGGGVAHRRRAGADQRHALHRRRQRHHRRARRQQLGRALEPAGLERGDDEQQRDRDGHRLREEKPGLAHCSPESAGRLSRRGRGDNRAWLRLRAGRSS